MESDITKFFNMCVQHAVMTSSSVPTPADVSQIVGSVMETMTAEICLTNRTAVSELRIL